MNMIQMVQQAQKIQKKVKEVQDELNNMEIKGQSNGDTVVATVDGQGKFKNIKLSKKALNPENPDSVDDETVEMLEDLIVQAMSEAMNYAKQEAEAKIKAVTGGINIPGLF